MKQVVYGCIISLIIILGIVAVVTLGARTTRRGDLNNALSISVENAVETTMAEKTYYIDDNKEFLADFSQNLLEQISNDSDVEIRVAKIDHEKGVMAVSVEQTFVHPNGNEGKSRCETTVVFEQVPTQATMITLQYMLDEDNLYKEYQIIKGDNVVVPKAPTKNGLQFKGWMEQGGTSIISEFGTAAENKTYIAVFQ